MKVIGMIRYAIPNAFQTNNSRDLMQLYEEPYFTDRYKIFRGVTLKSFANQTDKDFTLLVYHTDQIPAGRKLLFDELEKEYPFVKNIYIKDRKLYIPKELQQKNMITFRIDNDDGIVTDFIQHLKNTVNHNNNSKFVMISPWIRQIMRIGKDEYKTCSFKYMCKTHSIGLAYYYENRSSNEFDGKKTPKCIMDLGAHAKIYKNNPTLFLNCPWGLQIINGYNSINTFGLKHYKEFVILNKEAMLDLLKKEGFAAIDLESLPILKIEKEEK